MRKSNGWGLGTMLVLMGILFFFAIVAAIYIYIMYTNGVFGAFKV